MGIDVGADRLHCAYLDGTGRLMEGRLFTPTQLQDLTYWIAQCGVTRVAIDAPAAPSDGYHHDDTRVNHKFQSARCCEIALGKQRGIWVPWVTPLHGAATPDWMKVGFELYQILRMHGIEAMEVYPYGIFRSLDESRKLPKKTSFEGQRERLDLLSKAGVDIPIQLLSHDGIDAVAAALVAWGPSEGIGCRPGDGRVHDQSRIWLPASGPPSGAGM